MPQILRSLLLPGNDKGALSEVLIMVDVAILAGKYFLSRRLSESVRQRLKDEAD